MITARSAVHGRDAIGVNLMGSDRWKVFQSGDKSPHSKTRSRPVERCVGAKRFGVRRFIGAFGK
jgi:hypothetical protein